MEVCQGCVSACNRVGCVLHLVGSNAMKKFFCKGCGKELKEGVVYDEIKGEYYCLTCSDLIHVPAALDERNRVVREKGKAARESKQ